MSNLSYVCLSMASPNILLGGGRVKRFLVSGDVQMKLMQHIHAQGERRYAFAWIVGECRAASQGRRSAYFVDHAAGFDQRGNVSGYDTAEGNLREGVMIYLQVETVPEI